MSGPNDVAARLSSKVTALQHLPQDQARDLVGLLVAAHQYETETLGQAIDTVLDSLPRPVRAVTRKIMFGGR